MTRFNVKCWGCAILGSMLIAGLARGDDLKRRGLMGVHLAPLNEETRERLKLGDVKGVLLTAIVPGSAAEKAGLKGQDILVRVDEATVTSTPELMKSLRKYGGGDTLKFTVLREGKEQSFDITLAPRPMEQPTDYDVVYDSAGEPGKRVRTIITKPKDAKKVPAILFVQGLGPFSMEMPPQGPHPFRGLIGELAKSGLATMRVERLGIGDSEGADVHETTIEQDIASFKAALAKLKTYDFVDKDKVFILSHSSGGAITPMIAEGSGVRGIMTFAAFAKSFKDMLVEQNARISKLGLEPESEAKAKADKQKLFFTELFDNKKAPKEILAAHPELADYMKEAVQEDTYIEGIHYKYMQQIAALRPSESWKKVNVPVLAMWGEADFAASKADSELIASTVNAANPGKATFVALPKTDHMYSTSEDQEESFLAGGMGGSFNPVVVETITKWIKEKTSA